MPKTGRLRRRGLSLLELMITIVLLSTVLIAFAAVYPAGFKLNRKSQRATVAAQTAEAIAEEIRELPEFIPAGGGGPLNPDPNRPSLRLFHNFAQANQLPPADMLKTPIPKPFFLPNGQGSPLGVRVYAPDQSYFNGIPFAEIEVTLAWDESTNTGLQRRHVTVRTSATSNRI
ncbi:MAG: prepilin-type N-terminal cleavage/methylation domain-containing protein [Candidatus Eremiobacterota bacterium]